jgi:hypothetical protein
MLLMALRWSVRGSPEAPHYARPKRPQPASPPTFTTPHTKTQTISPHSYQQSQTEARKAQPARATTTTTTKTTGEKNHVAQKPLQNPRSPLSRRGPPPPHHHHHHGQRVLSSSPLSLSLSTSLAGSTTSAGAHPSGPGTNLARSEWRARGDLVRPRPRPPQRGGAPPVLALLEQLGAGA